MDLLLKDWNFCLLEGVRSDSPGVVSNGYLDGRGGEIEDEGPTTDVGSGAGAGGG